MKQIKNMSQAELAAYIQDALETEGIKVVFQEGVQFHFIVVTNMFQKIWTRLTQVLPDGTKSS